MIHLPRTAHQFADAGLPGISAFSIWSEDGRGADFVRFEAGARFPLHDHEGPEQILMVSGRIRFGDLVLSAGDYLRIGPGERHDAEALEESVFFLDHLGGAVLAE